MSFASIAAAFLAGLIPSLIWLFFWLREDARPEPRWLLVCLFLGGVAAVIVAILGERYVADLVPDPNTRYTVWAGIEEISKFLAVAIIALFSDYNDEPIETMMYCIVVALGFAALENSLFILGPLSNGSVVEGIITGNMRFMGATLVHVVSSASVGFFIGLTYYRGSIIKIVAALVGIAVAISLHAAFNISLINGTSNDTMRSFAWVWGAVVILIVLFEEVKAVHPRVLL